MDLDLILVILVGIGAIIFVHEMGHFIVAKLSGVRVDGFSMGFPPTGLCFRRTPDGLSVTVLPSFLGYFPLEVGGLETGGPADAAGLKLGDRILAANEKPVEAADFRGFEDVLRDEWSCGRAVSLLVERDGEKMTLGPIERPAGPDLAGIGLYPHLAAQKHVVSSGDSWIMGLARDEIIKAVGSRRMGHRDDFRKFAFDAIARGTGIVRLSVCPIRASDDPETSGREIVLLIQRPPKKPRFVFTLPILKGVEGQTEYRLSLIPVGGYVKMAGDAPGEGTGRSDEFLQKPVGVRAAIIAAGSFTNILFALLVFVIAFQIGVRFSKPVVGSVVSGSPAHRAGILPGDRITKIDGEVVTSFLDIPSKIAFSDPDKGAVFDIERGEEGSKCAIQIKVMPEKDAEAGRLEIGVYPQFSSVVQAIRKNSPVHEAGLAVKDRIVEIDGLPVRDKDSLQRAFEAALASGRPGFEFRVERGGQLLPPMSCPFPPDSEKAWRIGIRPDTVFAVKSAGNAADPLRAGDVVKTVNREKIGSRDLAGTVFQALGSALSGEIAFGVVRDGSEAVVKKTFSGEADHAEFFKGLSAECSVRVESVSEDSDFRRIGGAPGDVIVAIGGSTFQSLGEMQKIIQSSEGSEIGVSWINAKGQGRSGRIRPIAQINSSLEQAGVLELAVSLENMKLSFGDSIVVGFKKSIEFASDIFKMIKGIFTRKLSPKNIGGPVLIFKASYHFAEQGLGMFLFFLGILGINLGIINLFPIPILDGGHLAFLAVEKVKGSPLSEPVQVAAQYAGLLILLLLMIYVTAQDVLKLVN